MFSQREFAEQPLLNFILPGWIMNKFFCFIFAALFLASGPATAGILAGSGLEVPDYKKLDILVDYINREEVEVSLTPDDIIERIKLFTKKGGIQVNEEARTSYHLYVNILVVRNGFNVTVKFNRPVLYRSLDHQYEMMATVWNKSITGTGGSNHNILSSLDTLILELLNEYIKINHE